MGATQSLPLMQWAPGEGGLRLGWWRHAVVQEQGLPCTERGAGEEHASWSISSFIEASFKYQKGGDNKMVDL